MCPMTDDEFLQAEEDRLCLYRKGTEGNIKLVCYVYLVERKVPERAEDRDEAQDRLYAEDLEARIQRMVDARFAEQRAVSGGGGPMVPPLSSAHEWGNQFESRQAPTLPDFGRQGEEGQGGHADAPHWPYVRAKQEEDGHRHPLDDCFCPNCIQSAVSVSGLIHHKPQLRRETVTTIFS